MVSATTGRFERALMSTTRGRLSVNGLALQGQMLYVTYATGRNCSSGTAGCGPVPGTCGAEVDRFDLTTGSRRVVWQVGRDALLMAATPSPDGTRIAALTSPCVSFYFNQHVAVRDLTKGTTTNIGAGLPRCHDLRPPAWTGDGEHLVVSYAPAAGSTPYTGPDGTCAETGRSGLVTLDATHDQPGISGHHRPARRGCRYDSIAAHANDVYAVMACGLDGPAFLQRLDDALRPGEIWPLGRYNDGSSLAVNRAGSVLVSAYLCCALPKGEGPPAGPVTLLERLGPAGLTRVSATPGGIPSPDLLTW